MPASDQLLRIDDLSVDFGAIPAVRGVTMQVAVGETLGVVGESGSGKSVTWLAALGLLGPGGRISSGSVYVGGRDVTTLEVDARRGLLGKDLAMVFQNPTASLNPVISIGAQIAEALRIHDRSMSRKAARAQAIELLDRVGITRPAQRADQYPHEFSGGMCQRAMVAIAIANQPTVLVADEPTTAVDVTVQAQLLALLRDVRANAAGAAVLISHDLGVIAQSTDRVAVMYGGRVMEEGTTREVLADPRHPYTQGLLSCRPRLSGGGLLAPIPGQPPSSFGPDAGCPFQPRCPIGRDDERCATETPPLATHDGRALACHHPGTTAFSASPVGDEQPSPEPSAAPLLAAKSARVEFGSRRLIGRRGGTVRAVDDVDLDLHPGRALGLVGESGSGKSTLARMLIRLVNPDRGAIVFDGVDITSSGRRALRPLRDRVQVVFQDPFHSLNPQLSVGDNAAEPLRLRGMPTRQRKATVLERFAEVGLAPEHYDRLPTELSGGQLQRVGIARALSVSPDLLVLDEPVSALDVSVQAQILNLLRDLKAKHDLAYLFISHDMSVVRYLCDDVAVMYLGRIVEQAPTEQLFTDPAHPYTRGLLAAIPEVTATAHPTDLITGELVQAAEVTEGCRFRPRCHLAEDRCAVDDPRLERIGPDRSVACVVRSTAEETRR